MLTVSNLEYVQNNSIKKALGQLSDAFGVDISEDLSVSNFCSRLIFH